MSESSKTWLEKADEKLVDEFHYGLLEIAINSLWNTDIGSWVDILLFFDYFESQIEIISNLRKQPLHLRSYLQMLNPSDLPRVMAGTSKRLAQSNLPINRRKVFLFNALSIKFENLLKFDSSLQLVVKILKELLCEEIFISIRFLGDGIGDSRLHLLANQVRQFVSLKKQATIIINFLTEIIESSGIKDVSDDRDTLLFMREQLEIRCKGIDENKNRVLSAFGDNHQLKELCLLTYYEFFRINSLANLEGLQHLDLSTKNDNKLKTQGIVEVSAEIGKHEEEKKTQSYPPSYRKSIIDAAVHLSEKFDSWNEYDLVEELSISKSTLDRQKRFFGLKIQMIRNEAREIIREKDK